jgi:hypothetical protein
MERTALFILNYIVVQFGKVNILNWNIAPERNL